ncbi:MAG: divergent polysaccharide deacetylase family protein [Deltaproteobacteria bacterium]
MDRRTFLLNTSSFVLGNLLGINSLSKAIASDHVDQRPPIKPCLAIIIDDIGASLSHAKLFLDLHVPMTFAVLPRLAVSEESASLIHGAGHEIMLHQPMEPRDRGLSPGPGALYVGDQPAKISHTVEDNFSSVPFATGMNNHMGSRFTASAREMREALQVVKNRGLFFVDSLTTGDSKGYETARTLHLPAASRDVFLDNRVEEGAIMQQLHLLKGIAVRHGCAVGIGHPFAETSRALRRFLNGVKGSELDLVYMSEILLPAAS